MIDRTKMPACIAWVKSRTLYFETKQMCSRVRPVLLDACERVLDAREALQIEADNELFTLAPLFNEAGEIECVVVNSGPLERLPGSNLDVQGLGMRRREQDKAWKFLAEASKILTGSFDTPTIVRQVAELAVGEFGDWCAVELEDDAALAVAYAFRMESGGVRGVIERRNTPPEGLRDWSLLRPEVLEAWPVLPETLIARLTRNAEHAQIVRRLGVTHGFAVPLTARGRTFGTLTVLARAERGAFTLGGLQTAQELAHRAAVAFENARLYRREHRVAQILQEALLPAELPRVAGFAIDTSYRPSSAEANVGGDWYDAFLLADGSIALSIGDVSGHGVRAAVVMNAVRRSMRAAALNGDQPLAVLACANRVLLSDQPSAIVTAIFGVLDPFRRIFTYAGAGHPAPFLAREPSLIEPLPIDGIPLGIFSPHETVQHRIAIPKDALLVFYTDGLIEYERDILSGLQKFKAAIAAQLEENSGNHAHAISDRTLAGKTPFDDAAIITLACGKYARPASGKKEPASEFSSTRFLSR